MEFPLAHSRAVAVEGVISVLMPDAEAAMLALQNRTSRPVHVPTELRRNVRPGSKVVALLDGLDVVDWTLCA